MAPFTSLQHSLLLLLPVVVLLLATTSGAAPSPADLAARLKLPNLDGAGKTTSSTCWETLMELHACTGEIILFFVNGETTHLGKGCCRAIRTITEHCWPSMMESLGFTTEEGDVLDRYCKKTTTAVVSPPPPPPVVWAPAPSETAAPVVGG